MAGLADHPFSPLQIKGYGTYLMNHLKAYGVHLGCTELITYADNSAVGYFEKQGFTANLTASKSRIDGYVKVGCGS